MAERYRRNGNDGKSSKSRGSQSDRYKDSYSRKEYQHRPRTHTDKFEDVSSYSSRKEYNKKKKNKGKKRVLKTVMAVVCVLLILGGTAFLYVSTYLLQGLTTTTIPKDLTEIGINSGVRTDAKIKNIALFGLDQRSYDSTARSDAIMILTVDNIHGKLKLTSVLRDSKVIIEGQEDKLAHAYAYGGYKLAIKTLNQNFNMDITDYISVNFAQMASIVDAFGGTVVNVTEAEAQEININLETLSLEDSNVTITQDDYLYSSGDVLLNGNQAVAYSRIRYLGNDDERALRQQEVLKGLLSQVQNMSKTDYLTLLRNVAPLSETSLGIDDIILMAPIIFTDFSVETLTIPSEEDHPTDGYLPNGSWVYVFDLESAAGRLETFVFEDSSN